MDYSWLLIASILVFFMQAGFLCLESGQIRSKNSINVAAKNISDFIIAVLIYWVFGFALMFGDSLGGVLGTDLFFVGEQQSAYQISFFLFQMMFCGTAATLVSGAVAERMSFMGYLSIAAILSAFIYPVAGHWAWASNYQAANQGWLEQLGFIDFAGSTVVHSVGGWVALAAIIVIGPRIGRFDSQHALPSGSNLPMSLLGTLLIWLGWFGFNGGSTLVMNNQVPLILLNTCLAAVGGGFVASLCHYWHKRYVDVGTILNGIIAGLVAITAGCHAVTPKAAMLIGMIAGIILYFGRLWIAKLKIDDALGVVPVHLFAGIWGTLAVALFADLSVLGTDLTRSEQLFVQLIGVLVISAYSFGLSFLLLLLVNRFFPLRVSAENELLGMNISEHRASTELIDLLGAMNKQESEGKFSQPVTVEPFTEVGQIASQYNKVIKRVDSEISNRDSAINKYKSSEKRKSAILDSSMDSIVSIDLEGAIIEFNPAAERTFGYSKSMVINKNFIDLFILESDQAAVWKNLAYKFLSAQGLVRDHRNSLTLNRHLQSEFPAEITITGASFGSEIQNEFTLHIRDVTRQLKLQGKLKLLAYSDPLTGLYNRTYLMDSLTTAINRSADSDRDVVMFFLDLDRFKKINDTLGHKAGDELLCEVATRLISVTRNTDIIARWGGDEFVILFTEAVNQAFVDSKATEILKVMRQPLALEGRVISIPTSIGIATVQPGITTAEQLVQQADLAMYSAKQGGRDNYQIFKAEMGHQAARDFDHEQDMRKGIAAKDQFFMVYQPKVTADNQLVGLEALMRWQHPQEGLISPADFIPLAEESNLIIELSEFAILTVLEQIRRWLDSGYEDVTVAINITGKHLVSGTLVPYISELLTRFDIEGTAIEIEITEGVLLTDVDRCIEVMSDLKSLGIKISIDDFGTGYSSLSYLKRLPIDVLKIDKSFVDDCAISLEDGEICATIINLAINLELTTVAEGVETQEQLDFLVAHGCDTYQGYFFHKPNSAQVIEKLLQRVSTLV
ncbi:ammonium transporter [Psychromonas ingrahamii 37]|uniref:Ammonium transporter n=1 Tax=Psychromonas ingrahamii (strain DSM 17664 / CCUG 51855 / 37) TaxID=357804 RepID=A1SY01_PSYIN|nr:ammonium transporter [Psychromonas ingrahamii]ABM04366.1 ammonium transporter [Psychromonas ingrahamii 37]